jgi:integrase
MPRLKDRIPRYRLHRRSRQAVVTLSGRDHYLGPHGTEASRIEYDRLVAEWLAHGRMLPEAAPADDALSVTINQVLLGFWKHAEVHYRRSDGRPGSELDNYRQALRPLRRLYGDTEAAQFGPRALKALRQHMIDAGWCRSQINRQVSRVRTVFRWAVENELVPAQVHQGLLAVRGLQRGRTLAREASPIRSVPEERVAAVEPFVSRPVWALIQLQQLTGARAGELVALRGCDLKTANAIWTAELEQHKTAHKDLSRCVYFGPRAQAILNDFLPRRMPTDYLFSPSEAESQRPCAFTAHRGVDRATAAPAAAPACGDAHRSPRHPR